MQPLQHATISGFNEFKNDQAKEDGAAYMTLTLFDTTFETIAHAVPIADVPDLDDTTYNPHGMTALYDAIAHTMRITDDFVSKKHPDQVLFVIMTDGEENSSREYRRDQIFDMIKDRQDRAGYEFIYLGANQDSYAAGRGMGVRDGRTLDYAATPSAARDTMLRASNQVKAHRRIGNPQTQEFFSPEMDALGLLSAEEWAAAGKEKRETLRKAVEGKR